MTVSSNKKTDSLLRTGNEAYCRGDYAASIPCYQQILETEPAHFSALINLSQSYYMLKQNDRARHYAAAAQQSDPLRPQSWFLTGCILFDEGRFAEAAISFRAVIKIDSQDFWAHNYLSQALQKKGDHQGALQEAKLAVELSGGEESQQLNFAYALYEAVSEKKIKIAKPFLKWWRQTYPKDSLVRYFDSALSDRRNFRKADSRYVQKIFDNFAETFEDSLAELSYNAPRLIAQEIKDSAARYEQKILRILDLGCGTGLCGKYIAETMPSARLSGVDLSAAMLSQAAAKNIYEQLIHQEIESYLAALSDKYDLAVAADVLTYFGDLSGVFSGVFNALDSAGCFLFTLSENSLNRKDYFLHCSGRFVHREKYWQKQLAAAGFSLQNSRREILRYEGETPVWGWIITAEKK